MRLWCIKTNQSTHSVSIVRGTVVVQLASPRSSDIDPQWPSFPTCNPERLIFTNVDVPATLCMCATFAHLWATRWTLLRGLWRRHKGRWSPHLMWGTCDGHQISRILENVSFWSIFWCNVENPLPKLAVGFNTCEEYLWILLYNYPQPWQIEIQPHQPHSTLWWHLVVVSSPQGNGKLKQSCFQII